MDYIFFIHSINFVHKSLHYWTRDCFKNNRRSPLMKTKSTINLFATAIIATASIGVAGAITQSNTVTANEVTVTERDGFPAVTFETDAVFKNFEEANAYAEGRAAEILDSTDGYKDYSLTAGPALDGTSNYLVSGEIRAYKNYSGASVTIEQAKKNIEAAARKVVNEANPSISTTKPVTPTKPTEDVKPETPAKPVDEGKTSSDIKEITDELKFTEIKTTPTGLTFKAKLPELAPHAGPILPNIHATLTDKATGKEVSKSSVVLEGLSEEFKKSNPLLYSNLLVYSNLLEGTIFEPSLTPGNYVLTVEGTTGPTYGQNTDKRKRHFVFSTEVTLTGEGNSTTTTQPEKPKDSTTEPKSDQTTNNNQQPSNDQNKQSTNNNTGKQDKNELSTNKNSDTKTGKQNSDNTLSQEKQQTTSTSNTKPDDNKNNDKNTLPNTGESTSILEIIGTILSIAGLGFIVKRKRG